MDPTTAQPTLAYVEAVATPARAILAAQAIQLLCIRENPCPFSNEPGEGNGRAG